jgi:hypothetical protein
VSLPAQLDLPAFTDPRPAVLEATGDELFSMIARVNKAAGFIESVSHNRSKGTAAWLLRIHWPGEPRA